MTVRATVLAYHGVGDPPPGSDPHNLFVSPQRFAAQMAWLAAHRRVVPLAQALDGPLARDRRTVALTFDDAYRHLLDAALPVLERHALPSTVFVPTAHLGGRNTWDAPTEADLAVMSADELRDAERHGMRAESHGHVHLDCRQATPAEVEHDLRQSQHVLADVVGRVPRMLAWPFRDGSPQAQDVARRLGFSAALSIDLPHAGRFSHARVQVTPRDGTALFALKTSGCWTPLRYAPVLDGAYRGAKRLVRRATPPS